MGLHGRLRGFGGEGGRMRRGMVPDLVLTALLDGPAHGYELMDRLERFSGGSWRPSPGSICPLLQMFQDTGLVSSSETDGRERAAQRRVDAFGAGFPADPPEHSQLRTEMHQLRAAAQQVSAIASPEAVDQAVAIVKSARQARYRLLAEQ
ncbi:PadR family transcriptional regulator [Actinoplanes flavus]|uniref:PadR family transcriptional regulator n=1 Tax=Actinoplanes flavus TaxID=2820290 RepID=A0ABS3UWG8_9ACTN|nr:PadR family transcriptional regulator [Actinoplanes flavus]MBO3742937.1 PadR family transcriptional regulator [Actinoplanes flavus]